MISLENQEFNEYMEEFKKLSLREKQDIVLGQLKILTTLTNKMCEALNVDNQLLVNRELIDVEQENYTEDDFAEAVIVLVNSIQNSLCDFDLKLTDVMKYVVEKDG